MSTNRELYMNCCAKIFTTGFYKDNVEDVNYDQLKNVITSVNESIERCLKKGEEPTTKDVLAMSFYANTLLPLVIRGANTIREINKCSKQYEYEFILADSEESNDDSN